MRIEIILLIAAAFILGMSMGMMLPKRVICDSTVEKVYVNSPTEYPVWKLDCRSGDLVLMVD